MRLREHRSCDELQAFEPGHEIREQQVDSATGIFGGHQMTI
jgi:hypothetical protein